MAIEPADVVGAVAFDSGELSLLASPIGEPWNVSADLALVSDYRRGGVSRSGHKPAVQLGVSARRSGWSVSAWASTIDTKKNEHYEISLSGSKTFAIGETDISIGATVAMEPETEHSSFGIAQISVSRAIGPIDATLAVNYAWEQANLDNEDNLYVSVRARTPLGRFAGVPLTLAASAGRAEGRLAIEDLRHDWSLSLVAEFGAGDVGLSFVDTDLTDQRGEAGLVLSFARRF